MSFSAKQALLVCTNMLATRVAQRTNAYTLHCSNDGETVVHHIHGVSMKDLKREFSSLGTSYKYAFITKRDDYKVIQFYNQALCRKGKDGVYKFFSMTKKKKN